MQRTDRFLSLVCLALALAATPNSVHAEGLPAASPEAVGLSPRRLDRIDATMAEYIRERRIGGAITLIARRGKVAHLASHGQRDLQQAAPMRKDDIFRIASMSKAITSMAVLLLMEEGRLLLSDPVSKFIPAFRQTTVAVPPPDGAAAGSPIATVRAKREITIQDLLTHTAGISYGDGPAEAQYKAAGIHMWYLADKAEPIGRIVERLAKLPFAAQPGERFVYGYNTDVLGSVIERISGQPLDVFLRTRIFEPLKMSDTSFFLPPQKRGRLATVYRGKEGGGIERAPETGRGQGSYVDGPRACFSGGAGLLSTASDYARFLQMLLNGGELEKVRLLSPKTVELATANHVGSLFNDGRTGFGLGFEIVEHLGRAGRPGSVGEFGWAGAYYTSFWVDPKEKLVAVFLAQILDAPGLDLQDKFRALVYQAIVAPP